MTSHPSPLVLSLYPNWNGLGFVLFENAHSIRLGSEGEAREGEERGTDCRGPQSSQDTIHPSWYLKTDRTGFTESAVSWSCTNGLSNVHELGAPGPGCLSVRSDRHSPRMARLRSTDAELMPDRIPAFAEQVRSETGKEASGQALLTPWLSAYVLSADHGMSRLNPTSRLAPSEHLPLLHAFTVGCFARSAASDASTEQGGRPMSAARRTHLVGELRPSLR